MSTLTRAEFRPAAVGVEYRYDAATAETVASMAPLGFSEEFIGFSAAVPAAGSPAFGSPWVKKIVGAAPPTVTPSTAAQGIVTCALTSTSEAQEASLYFNDQLYFDTRALGMAEWRAALPVAPTGVAQAAIGLGGAWVGGPTSLARYLMFLWNASTTPTLYWKDGGSNTGTLTAAVAGVNVVTDTNYHLYRIDWSNPADIAFYIDGSRANAAGSIAWAPGANSLQPWHTVYKASGAGVGSIAVNKLDIFNGR